MKKSILLMIIAVFGIGTANAQFTKGKTFLSADASGFNFGVNNYGDNDAVVSFTLKGKGSYFVIDKLALTAGLGFGYNKQGDFDYNAIEFEIGGRYYIVNGLYGSLAYEGIKPQYMDMYSFARLQVGYDIFINDNVFFEPAVNFRKGFGSAAGDVFGFDLSIGIGLAF